MKRDLASADARRFTQIESMSLMLHSFKSSKPLKDILREELGLIEPYRIQSTIKY